MNVIVTDTHTRMALSAVRELGERDHNVTSVTTASRPSLGHASRWAARRVTLPDEGYADTLLELAGTDRPVLLPAGAPTLNAAAARRDEFLEAFRMLLPERSALDAAGDKPSAAEAARSLGLLVPDEYQQDSPSFPCVVKYRNGEALRLHAPERYAIARNAQEYDRAMAAMSPKGEVFVSQYIEGCAFGVSALLNGESEPLTVLCHERVREYPVSGGPACLAKAVWHGKLVDSALTLLKAMRLTGFAMVEFKGSPENPYVLEINPRVWGTFPLARHCGLYMADMYVREAMGERLRPDRECRYTPGVRMQYLASDLMCMASSVRMGVRTRGSVIGDCLSGSVKGGVFDWRDLPGTAAYAASLLKRRGGRA